MNTSLMLYELCKKLEETTIFLERGEYDMWGNEWPDQFHKADFLIDEVEGLRAWYGENTDVI